MLAYNEVVPHRYIIVDGQPFEVLDSHVFRKQMRKPVNQTKLKNLITGKVTEISFHQAETITEADISFKEIAFLYANRGEFWFSEVGNPRERFSLPEDVIGPKGKFLKGNSTIEAMVFDENIIDVRLPVKVDLRVKEAPPGLKGDTRQGGSKQVVLETGAVVNAPLFVNEGDVLRINTETGDYVERVEKS